MRSFCLSLVLLALPLGAVDLKTLRVCADPNNLPFSNDKAEGFENRLSELLAHDLGAKLEYVWFVERKSLVKNTLDEGRCDMLLGVPSTLQDALVTRPYYRSSYVFVSRRDRDLHLNSLLDDRLDRWRIGMHVVGDDYAPPSVVLGRRGLAANLKGFSLFGKYGEPNPPARLIDAVASGDVDLAIVWGPLAGYFAQHEKTALEIAPVSPSSFGPVPFVYDISLAVRKGNEPLRAALDVALRHDCAAVQSILKQYAVPLLAREGKESCDVLPDSPVASWH